LLIVRELCGFYFVRGIAMTFRSAAVAK